MISNALKYTKKGDVWLDIYKDGDYVTVKVSDNGMGMKQEDIPELFQKFHRLNNYTSNQTMLVRPGGTGLGLYIVKGIMELHKGKAWAESEGEGKGSSFYFSLPLYAF